MGGFGRIIGAVVGAAIGYLIGGPTGAMWGFSLGGIAGGLIDPARPASSAGVPVQQLQITKNEVGTIIPDVLGTSKITGIFLCYGKERHKKIKAKSGGKGGMGGGGGSQTVGYKYYMSWVQAVCAGSVDTLYAIYSDNDTLLWEGKLHRPVSGGKETIVLEDFGSMDFYFGTDDHAVNTKIGAVIGDATLNSPLRGLCYAFFDDCYIGTTNRCPSIHFVVRKTPVISSLPSGIVSVVDYNPANAIWYILHNLTGLPESWLHIADFISAANTLKWEGRGLSLLFENQQSALDYLININSHIDSIIQYGSDGKFHPKLIRNDYDVASLPLVDEDVFLDDPALKRASWIDTINEIKVQYSEITDSGRTSPGSLWTWGNNTAGQLGSGTVATARSSPVQVGALTNWETLIGDLSSTLAIKADGTLWAWGLNSSGQLGFGDIVNRSSPVQVGALTNWEIVAGFQVFTMAIKTDKTLWAWGGNTYGMLGLGDIVSRSSPVQVGSLADWGIVRVGDLHAAAIKTNGTLWAWGRNNYGQLGLGDIVNRSSPVQVGSLMEWENLSCGVYHTLLIKTDGTLWVCGYNGYGQLGLGDIVNRSSPVQVGALTDWMFLSGGTNYTLVIKTDGTLWAWGRNEYGQLGLGDTVSRSSPVQVGSLADWTMVAAGYTHTLAIKTDGTLWAWGHNAYGQLGTGNRTYRSSPVQVGALTDWVSIAAGGERHSAAIREA